MYRCIAEWSGIEADTQREMLDEEYIDGLDRETLDVRHQRPEGEIIGNYIVCENPLRIWEAFEAGG